MPVDALGGASAREAHAVAPDDVVTPSEPPISLDALLMSADPAGTIEGALLHAVAHRAPTAPLVGLVAAAAALPATMGALEVAGSCRAAVIKCTLAALTTPRVALNATDKVDDEVRLELMPWAEAFAAAVLRGLVKVDGAMSTVITLLLTDDTCIAGAAALGKTIEGALALITAHASTATMRKLHDALNVVESRHPALAYDVAYARRNLPPPAASPDSDIGRDLHAFGGFQAASAMGEMPAFSPVAGVSWKRRPGEAVPRAVDLVYDGDQRAPAGGRVLCLDEGQGLSRW